MHDASLWALCLSDISKAFGGLMAVDGVSLQVKPGERRALLGPHGAGETTLLYLISGELAPTSGHIHLFGREVPRYRRSQSSGARHPAGGAVRVVGLACGGLRARAVPWLH